MATEREVAKITADLILEASERDRRKSLDLVEELKCEARAEGYAAGQRDMQDRAANQAESYGGDYIAERIRNMPIQPEHIGEEDNG